MKYSLKERKKRSQKMLSLYKKGKTMEEVGKIVGLTRERVRQVISPLLGFLLNKYSRGQKFEITCSECGKSQERISSRKFKNNFCDKKCSLLYYSKNKLTPEEKRKKWNEYRKKYYHNIFKHRPDFRDIVRRYNLTARKKLQSRKRA